MIKLFSPYIPPETDKAIRRVLESGCLTQGKEVELFEQKFCKTFEQKYAVSVNSGTSALETAYDLLGLREDDEVITTPLTCTATNLPLLRRGVKLIWADILEDTLCIDPLDVRAKVTEKTKAVVQVHLGGVGADVGKMHIPVISDACQALGIFKGDLTCCSFQAIKHITTGDGGMLVLTTESDLYKAKLLRWFGIDRERKDIKGWEAYKERMMTCEPQMIGHKRHMNDLTATIGSTALRYYHIILDYRQKLFDLYKSKLNKLPGIKVVDGIDNVCWLMTVLVDHRDDFARMLHEHGIECNVVQIRNDLYKIFGGSRADLPVLNQVEHRYVSLPLGMHVTIDDVNYICGRIEKGW